MTDDAKPTSSGAAPISVVGLTKVYGGRRVLDGLTFDVSWGSVTGFLGPNGAGKTTAMRTILGLAEPAEGVALVTGRRYRDLARPTRTVGAVLESNWFHARRTARGHLAILATAQGVPLERVERVLDLVGLAEAGGQRVGTFSLGMRQRLGLAASLLGAPKVLILDEPANGLDPAGIRWLRGALRRVAARGKAVFVSSHVLSEVAQLADELVVINRGRLVAQGSVDELTRGGTDLEDVFFDLLDRGGER